MSAKGKTMSRRDWLKSAGTLGLGSFLVSTDGISHVLQASSQDAGDQQVVPMRPFGRTGVRVAILSLGGMFDIPSNQLLLKQALKWGVTYWDTADCYEGGGSEEGIGMFFERYPETRKKVFLVSKSDSRDPKGITKLLDRSLDRMKTDYIDLYFLHSVTKAKELDRDVQRWAESAKAQGKIRFFGFSTHRNMEECMQAAAKLGWIDGIMMTYNFRLMHEDRMKAAVKACVEAGIGLTAMKTQGGGPVRMESGAELAMAGRFLRKGFTDKQAKLLAVWENPEIASICSQMPNLTILMSNVDAALKQSKLSSGDKRLLERYARETRSSYCAGCGRICESAIQEDVPISDIMRYLMYYHNYGERDRARELFAGLPEEQRQRVLSVDFSAAEGKCPQRLKIGRLLEEAADLLA